MGKVYFLFGVHNHQPVGNFGYVFEEAYNKCYCPFFDVLGKYPSIKCNVHISGPLYDWILAFHKEFIDRIGLMVKKGQLEIVSGGYYEPILPIIPDRDKISQIKLMNSFIRRNFNTEPEGIWVAERVWEPYLARVINEASLKYTFLDDTHFRYAGAVKKEFFGRYVTEDSGRSISIFPISKTLRYKIPFSKAEEAVSLLKSFANKDKDVLVTLFDDGEKFGLWPHTYDWVYTKKWLDNFFRLLVENSDTIQTIKAKEAMDKFIPEGLIYLPTASYEEMAEWVLTPENLNVYEGLRKCAEDSTQMSEFSNFIRGGFFRNFYTKYPRLNFMHKRMLYISDEIHSRGAKGINNTLKHLLMAQCNCGYWHGIFGGFYLGHIRGAIYDNLIEAESEFDRKVMKKPLSIERQDLDFDGHKETIIKNKHLITVLSDKGGTLIELSYKDRFFNLLNTITRKEESYHSKIREKVKSKTDEVATIHNMTAVKGDDLDRYLIYDNYEKTALIDHLLDKDITLNDFSLQRKVNTLSNADYSFTLLKKYPSAVIQYDYSNTGLKLSKKVSITSKAAVKAEYSLNGDALKSYYFGVEFNLFLASPEEITFTIDGAKESFSGNKAFNKVSSFYILDGLKKTKVEFTLSKCDVFVTPLYSVSSSESGFEKVYQQLTVLFIKKTAKNLFNITCVLKKEERDG